MKRPTLPDDFADLLRQMRTQRDTRLGPVLLAAHAKGWTYQALADPLGVGRQAVCQATQRVEFMPADMPEIPDVPVVVKPVKPPRPEIPAEAIAQLREMQEVARRVNGGTPADHPSRRVSEQFAALIADLNQQGFGCKRIAKALDISPGAVLFRLARHGYRRLPPSMADHVYRNRSIGDFTRTDEGRAAMAEHAARRAKPLPLTAEQIAEKYRSGIAVWQLAEMCGCTQSIIRRRLRRAER